MTNSIKTTKKPQYFNNMAALLLLMLLANIVFQHASSGASIRILSKNKSSSYNLDKNKTDSSAKLIVPHPATNPKKETHHWEGHSVEAMIKSIAPFLPKKTPVTIVANDNYSIQLNYEDIINEKPFIATHRNKKQLNKVEGGVQLIFPKASKTSNEFARDSWWAWFNRAVVIGILEPIVKIPQKGLVNLNSLESQSSVTTGLGAYPPGMRKIAPDRAKVQLRFLKLSALLKVRSDQKAVVKTISGKTTEFEASSLALVWQRNSKTIDPWLGGPVQACILPELQKCEFLVEEIELK